MHQSGMAVVTTTNSLAEAEVVAGVLRASGLNPTVDADDAARTNPELDLTRGVRILVAEADVERARAILAEAEAMGRALPDDPEVESGL